MLTAIKSNKEIDANKAIANNFSNKSGGNSVNKPKGIQTKLTIGQPNDKYEQEADRVADRVMTMPESKGIQRTCSSCMDEEVQTKPLFQTITPLVQRQTIAEEEEEPMQTKPEIKRQPEEEEEPIQAKLDIQKQKEEEEEPIQTKLIQKQEEDEESVMTKSNGKSPQNISSSVESEINQSAGQGASLPDNTRTFMENRFRTDFSHVRVHSDSNSVQLNKQLNSQAFTKGSDIYFNSGKYNPESSSGKHLLAHELTHTIQQKGSRNYKINRQMIVQRKFKTPQKAGKNNARHVTVSHKKIGKQEAYVGVTRTLENCPCRQVNKTQKGIFYNDKLNNLAIVYSYCKGGTRIDTYGRLQSNAKAFLKGTAPPKGTARVGITVNLSSRKVGSKILLEVLGNKKDSGKGVGGRAQIVFQGSKWRVFLESSFIRKLEQKYKGKSVHNLEVDLGGQFGNVKLRVKMNALLPTNTLTGEGTICIPVGGSLDLCVMVTGSKKEVKGLLQLRGRFSMGPKAKKVKCHTCYCPPAVPNYKCYLFVDPLIEYKKIKVPEDYTKKYRYYYKLNKTEPSEDYKLRQQSKSNLDNLEKDLLVGGKITSIMGFTSPEASEEHNNKLSMDRATKLKAILKSRLGSKVSLPSPLAGGEILGNLPSSSTSSSLGDVKPNKTFFTAEDLSYFLQGKHIENKNLAAQFKLLFEKLTSPKERLALFGLTEKSSIAKKVLKAINRFMKKRKGSYRPWESIFRLLRIAIAYVKMTRLVDKKEPVYHDSSFKKMGDVECVKYYSIAENKNKFGSIHVDARTPKTASLEKNDDCLLKPKSADIKKGCIYNLSQYLKQKKPSASSVNVPKEKELSPPDFAPKRLRFSPLKMR